MDLHIKVGLIIERQGKILLLKEWSNKKNGYFWNIIKGTFDKPGETLEECARREAEEEAKLQVNIEKLISVYVYKGDFTGIQFNFLAHPLGNMDPSKPLREEQVKRKEDIVNFKWVTKEQVQKIKPDQFVNRRVDEAIKDWQSDKSYALKSLSSWD